MRETFYSWNVNGVRAAARKGFVDWLHRSDAEIVAIQETRAAPDQLPPGLLQPAGYHADWFAAATRGYSGVATFSRHLPLRVTRGLGDARFDDAGRVLISEFAPLVFINVYVPNGGRGPAWVDEKLAFNRCLLAVVQRYLAAHRPVILAGDLNTAYAPIDLAHPEEHAHTSGFLPQERVALGQFFAAGLIDTFRFLHPEQVAYSYWDQRTRARARDIGWRLDYLLVSSDIAESIVAADVCTTVLGSDHCPVRLTLATSRYSPRAA